MKIVMRGTAGNQLGASLYSFLFTNPVGIQLRWSGLV